MISASGCAGIIQVGDNVTFSSNAAHGETVTGSPTSSIQISSP